MAVVTTHGLSAFSYRTQEPEYLAPDIDEIGKLGFTREHYEYDNAYNSAYVDNTPISLLPASAVTGKMQNSFKDDYYYRIHVNPTELQLGNLLSAQQREIEVWNAHFSSKLLSSIGESGTSGLELTEPETAPTTFGVLESRIYDLNISTQGAPVLNAVYTFNFPSESPTLTVTGTLVVIWPFIPQTRFTEQLEWKSDVVPSYNNEQVLALRHAPRQLLDYTFHLNEHQFSCLKAIGMGWSHQMFGIGVWAEATRVGNLSISDTTILFDTSYADYRDDDIILIWESDTKFEAVETLEILADRVNLKLPLTVDYTAPYVMPLRLAYALQGVKFKRGASTYIVARANFQITQSVDLSASLSYDTYKTKDVVTDRTVIQKSLNENIVRRVDIFDNGSGPIEVEVKNGWSEHIQVLNFDITTRSELWAVRGWLHSRYGKQKRFWLPSWNADLVLVSGVSSTSTTLTCTAIDYALYYDTKDIMIQKMDGTRLYNRVLSATTDSNGDEILLLENQVGEDLQVSDVDFISFMSHARFNTDRVRLQHSYADRVRISIPVVETPEE
jgi:hypothetical protein